MCFDLSDINVYDISEKVFQCCLNECFFFSNEYPVQANVLFLKEIVINILKYNYAVGVLNDFIFLSHCPLCVYLFVNK